MLSSLCGALSCLSLSIIPGSPSCNNTVFPAALRGRSDAHRHHDVTCNRAIGMVIRALAIGVAERQHDLGRTQVLSTSSR